MSTTQIRLIVGVAAAVVVGVIVFALVRDGGGDGFGATGPSDTQAAPPLTQPPLTVAPTGMSSRLDSITSPTPRPRMTPSIGTGGK